MEDPERIYLAPECCSGPEGRCWSDYKPEADCDDGVEATEYVRADALTALQSERDAAIAQVVALRVENEALLEVDRLAEIASSWHWWNATKCCDYEDKDDLFEDMDAARAKALALKGTAP